jgi:hypothetical protein
MTGVFVDGIHVIYLHHGSVVGYVFGRVLKPILIGNITRKYGHGYEFLKYEAANLLKRDQGLIHCLNS